MPLRGNLVLSYSLWASAFSYSCISVSASTPMLPCAYTCITIASLIEMITLVVYLLSCINEQLKSRAWVLFIPILIPSAKHSAWTLLRTSIFVDLKCHHFQNLCTTFSHQPQFLSLYLPNPTFLLLLFITTQRSLIPQFFFLNQVCNPFQGGRDFLPFHPSLILMVGLNKIKIDTRLD